MKSPAFSRMILGQLCILINKISYIYGSKLVDSGKTKKNQC